MGALCGKESPSDPFSQPGRTLSSAPAPQTTSSVPAQRKVGGPPRTLGGSSKPDQNINEDAGKKAGEAAERRAQEAKRVTGRLGKESLQERSKSTNTHLKEQAKHNLVTREIDKGNKDLASP